MGKRKNPTSEMITGGVLMAIFGSLWMNSHFPLFAIFFVFMGAVPFVKGLTSFIDSRRREKNRLQNEQQRTQQIEANVEHDILKIARSNSGRVTPALVSIQSGISLEQVDEKLQELVAKGYATMDILDSGRVEYVFSDFT